MVRALIQEAFPVFSLILPTANLHLFLLHPAGPSLRFALMIYQPTLCSGFLSQKFSLAEEDRCIMWGPSFWFRNSLCFLIFDVTLLYHRKLKDPDIQKTRKLTVVSFLREPFSSEFHVFVTFQSSHLDADIWKILQALLLYRKCILALQLYS